MVVQKLGDPQDPILGLAVRLVSASADEYTNQHCKKNDDIYSTAFMTAGSPRKHFSFPSNRQPRGATDTTCRGRYYPRGNPRDRAGNVFVSPKYSKAIMR